MGAFAPGCDAGPVKRLLPVLLAGCGGASHPTPAPAPEPPPAQPKRPHRIQPFELVLHGVPDTGVQRARLAAHGLVRLSRDGEWSGGSWSDPDGRTIAVAELDGDLVRVLNDEDDARVLVWIHRADLARVTTREIELRAGLVLAAGTPVDGAGRVALEGLEVAAEVPADALGDLWDAAPAVAREDDDRVVEPGAVIRSAPRADAEPLARVVDRIKVATGASADGWTEVETMGPLVRVRGYVRDVEARDELTFGTGSGGGYGVSHSISIELPAGACLYDDVDGEVIGVNLVARTRLAHQGSDTGWYFVMVNSPWELLRLPVRVEGDSFEVCVNDL